MWLWAAVAAAVAGIPHTKREREGASQVLMQRLDVHTAHHRAINASKADNRNSATLQNSGFLLPGQFKGLRIATVDNWFDDDRHTCQQVSPRTARFSNNRMDPRAFYKTQPAPTISVLNRDGSMPPTHDVKCEPRYVLTDTQKALLRTRVIPRLTSHLSSLLAPQFLGTGVVGGLISGNDGTSEPQCDGERCYKCLSSPHYVFQLPFPYQYDADVLVMFTAEPDHQAASGLACGFASDGRPMVVVINIAPNKLSALASVPRGEDKLHAWLLQAAFHALGFDPSLFSGWKVGSGPNYTIANPTGRGGDVRVIGTAGVKSFLMTEQFLCTGHPKGGSGELQGAELEDALGASTLGYWEKRLFKGEVLTKLPDIEFDKAADVAVVSGLTLAAFEDMGWYKTNKGLAQTLRWLHEEPCSTATAPCSEWSSRYVCMRGEATPQCSADFTSVATCKTLDWFAAAQFRIPEKFSFDPTLPTWGGHDPHLDFCPVREAVGQTSCLTMTAADPDCQNKRCADYQVRGEDSRCFSSSLHYPAYAGASAAQGRCIPHRCVKAGTPGIGQLQDWNVVLMIGGAEYTCDGSFSSVGPGDTGISTCKGDMLKGTVTCPSAADRRVMCEQVGSTLLKASCDPAVDCNGRGKCNADGTCACFTDLDTDGNPLYGMFTGTHCESCAAGYYGEDCRQRTCPIDPLTGTMCYGNGQCVNGACQCYGNATTGYWNAATSCSTCLSGYTGGTCKLTECKTEEIGSCRKGTCVAATRRCSCFENDAQGYWMRGNTGVCDRCRPGYDIHQSCKVRIENFFACDTPVLPDSADTLGCIRECPAGYEVAQFIPEKDPRGCSIDIGPPRCSIRTCAHDGKPRDGALDGCPNPTIVSYDCKGYPNLYHDCWTVNECNCLGPRKPVCIIGTDAVPSPDAYDPVVRARDIYGRRDERTSDTVETTAEKKCRCPMPAFRPTIDCWGAKSFDPGYPSGVQPLVNDDGTREKGRVVFFQPEQLFEEDFCHCTSPPIPQCSDETRPEWLLELASGERTTCAHIIRDFGCPDWDFLLNVGGVRNLTGPDLSLVDCDGWPAPKLKHAKDLCGCPFPKFKCIEGTMGVCADPPNCPKWDPLPPIDCLGQMPPVVALHASHPCGCAPPPTPTCIPGTERQTCYCDLGGGVATTLGGATCRPRDVHWIDCKSTPLEQPAWTPFDIYPAGDPFINTCNPCPQCERLPPIRRCLPGTSAPAPRLDNRVDNLCTNTQFNPSQCKVLPSTCPVDCEGKPRPAEPVYDPLCECPPEIPTPPCIPGTDGSPPAVDVSGLPCDSNAHVCGAYACGGGGQNLEHIAHGLGLSGDYTTAARERVIAAVPGTKYCIQEGQCESDYHCAHGYSCGPCGLCLKGVQAKAYGCLADRGASCGNFKCEVECDAEGYKLIRMGVRTAECKDKCTSSQDCRAGTVCSVGAYAPTGAAGTAYHQRVRMVMKAEDRAAEALPAGIPGLDPLATAPSTSRTDPVHPYVPLMQTGRCVAPEQEDAEAVLYCTSHAQCDGYACGRDHHQVVFSTSRCMSSCHVNAHCHHDYRCRRSDGRCVPATQAGVAVAGDTLPDGPSCSLQPDTYCSPYWCGSRGLVPSDGQMCPMFCTSNDHCQPFHECVFPSLASLRAKYGDSSATCDANSGVTTAATGQHTHASLASHADAAHVGKGTCEPSMDLRRRQQTATAADGLALVIPVGDATGFVEDPNNVRFSHAPFRPVAPLQPRSPGTPMQHSPAECHPYVAVAPGITLSQLERMRKTARAGFVDSNTASVVPYPSCRSFCLDDRDCVSGYFCTRNDALNKGKCQAKRGLGAECSDGAECGSGHCWHGLCCNTACDGECRTCERSGVCGWAAPHTAGAGQCSTCHWCEYVRSADGALAPSSPLRCAPVPEGKDPSDHCGDRGTCNGEGGCMAGPGYAGMRAEECAVGRSGESCEIENVYYRPVVVADPYPDHPCTPAEAAARSRSPLFDTTMDTSSTLYLRRATDGFAPPQTATPTQFGRVLSVVDRRPRQWAQRVLSVSSHSRYSCNNILGHPSKTSHDRVHEQSEKAWAPAQFVKAQHAGLPDEHPEKEYYPWVDCTNYLTQQACNSKIECKWHAYPAPGYCNADPTNADVYKMPGTLQRSQDNVHWARSSLPSTLPLETIELEFETAVYVESVVLHENFNPGSLIQIDIQPEESGSVRLARNGGGAPATDPTTGLEVPLATQPTLRPDSSVQLPSTCASLTSQGLAVCVADSSCKFEDNECKTTDHVCLEIGRDSCRTRQVMGLCHWVEERATCIPGREEGCYALKNYDASQFADRCSTFNDKVLYPPAMVETARLGCVDDRRCQYGEYTADLCVANTLSCTRFSGSPGLCVLPCLWNVAESNCRDPDEYPDGTTREQYCDSIKDAQRCGAASPCQWQVGVRTTGCRPWEVASCSKNLTQSECRLRAACEYVVPPVVAPPVSATQNCPQLAASYENGVSARYEIVGGVPRVRLVCADGYEQAEAVTCDTEARTLSGEPSCAAMTCPAYEPPAGMTVQDYTAAEGFDKRQEGSRPILVCDNGAEVTGTIPVCSNGAYGAGSPSCGGTGRRAAAQLAAAYFSSARQHYPQPPSTWFVDKQQPAPSHNATGSRRGAHALSAVEMVCTVRPDFEADPTVPGDDLDWASICTVQKTQGSCITNDADAISGSEGERATRCVWQRMTISPDTPVALPQKPKAEEGSYGATGSPVAFTYKDVGPSIPEGQPQPTKAETKPTPTETSCEDLPPGKSLNLNPTPFRTVWNREFPNFVQPHYRENIIDVAQVYDTEPMADGALSDGVRSGRQTRLRSKVVKLTFAPTADGRSMVDAVGIVGYATGDGHVCKGEVWRSPVRDGTRSTAKNQKATVVPVPCNGRGRCGPRGCECEGNFYGEGCETCKLGWTGTGCDVPVSVGCEEVAFEDLSTFVDKQEVRNRWKYTNYQEFQSTATAWEHFGTTTTSPKYNLGGHTHIKIEMGTIVVDVPDSTDCGLLVGISTDGGKTQSSNYEVIYTAGCEFFSGLNIVGQERGDKLGFFSATRRWPASSVVVMAEVWWGGRGTETYTFSVSSFSLQTCMYPDIGDGSADNLGEN